MSKDDPNGGLLSKMARFVLHPTVEWSELENRSPGVDQEREALKAAIQRKRRNDRVRHNELNALRLILRQRQAEKRSADEPLSGGATEGATRGASLQTPGGHEAHKSQTIEQIARIEEQMAQHWVPRRDVGADGAGLRIGAPMPPIATDRGFAVSSHLQSRARAGEALAIDVVAEDPAHPAQEWTDALSHSKMVEAAVRFANGEVEATRQSLEAMIAQEVQTVAARVAGLAMLDWYFAQGDVTGFEDYAAEYADRHALPVPRWPRHPNPASSAPVPAASPRKREDAVVWACPLLLDAATVEDLGRQVNDGGAGDCWLDWTELVSADLPAAQALLAQVETWCGSDRTFRFVGGAVLRRRLKASTPSGRRENDVDWWRLRLAMLRLMHRQDEFDLAALDYCVTYGVLPPEWTPPAARFEAADALPAAPEAAVAAAPEAPGPDTDLLTWPAMNTTIEGSETQFPSAPTTQSRGWPTTQAKDDPAQVALSGALLGSVPEVLQELDRALIGWPADRPFRIDASRLHRVDFSAAGVLLQWILTQTGQGHRVELHGLSRLVGAFFHVVGIDEAVQMRLRQY